MSTVERKEFQETKILRTVSPVRNFRSSNQNLAQFDSNLGKMCTSFKLIRQKKVNKRFYLLTDYLLEDLQNSVSRPGSSLGNNYTSTRTQALETGKNNTLNRLNVKASNPVTEYSSDDTYSYTVRE